MPESEIKVCQKCGARFIIEPEDFDFYKKVKVPPPTWCPECRLIRRLIFRNEKSFYKRTCDKCGKPIISVFPPDCGHIVYCSSCWWSDDWDGLDYGVDFDPQKPFLTQLHELLHRVPMMNLFGLYNTLINSDYTNMVTYLKDCYMVTTTDHGENLLYGCSIQDNSRDSVDNLMNSKIELCYELINCEQCYRTFFSIDCSRCRNVYFSKNCRECNDCFGCCDLRSKQYYFFNKPCSKEEYQKLLGDYDLSSYSKVEAVKERSREHWLKFPVKYIHGNHNVNSNGEYIYNSKNVLDSFIMDGAKDCRFCSFANFFPGNLSDTYDLTNYGINSSRLCETLQSGNGVDRAFYSWWVVTNSSEIEYSFFLTNCHNIFGSVGLKKKQYCILNKQYTKEKYEILRKQIMEQMDALPYTDKKGRINKYGEFFPTEMSPFAYNIGSAQEYFPLTKQQAIEQGYSWRDPEPRNYPIDIKAEDLPDNIKDVPDDIVGKVIECANAPAEISGENSDGQASQCTQAFRIIPQELSFYKRMNLPLPRLCPNCRHYQRLKQRNPLKLWKRQCMCSGSTSSPQGRTCEGQTLTGCYHNTCEHEHGDSPCDETFLTSYSPERPEIVYCEKCYLREVA
ncbi:MAG: hypothetical protein PHU56_02980 [Candidatus Pacebacteria bacterium]|nr:hypothetical protein [Candidatus Paceibacterota bacterium]